MNKFFSISWWGRGNILKVRWKSFPLNQIYMGKKKSNRIPVLFLAGKKKKKHTIKDKRGALITTCQCCYQHTCQACQHNWSPSPLHLPSPAWLPTILSDHSLPPQHSCTLPVSAIFIRLKFTTYSVLLHCPYVEDALLFALPHLFSFLNHFVHLFKNTIFIDYQLSNWHSARHWI